MAGFYVAHHPWLDAAAGPRGCFKVGFSADLSRRLADSCYTTCFPAGWTFALLLHTDSPAEARAIETAVLRVCEPRRLDGRELVALPLPAIRDVALWCAGLLGVPVAEAESLPAPPARPATAATETSEPQRDPLPDAAPGPDFQPSRQPAWPMPAAVDGLAAALAAAGFDTRALASRQARRSPAASPPSSPEGAGATPPPAPAPGDGDDGEDEDIAEVGDAAFAGSVAEQLALADELDALEAEGKRGREGKAGLDLAGAGPAPLRDYQARAAEDCLRELRAAGRAVLQMACRCGKTRVAHAAMEALGPGDFLFLVPGLALLRQTAQKLAGYSEFFRPENILLVGSDPTPVRVGGRELRMTTAPAEVAAFFRTGGGAARLAVSTYQSSPLLLECGALPEFTLVVFDEAHRTCGGLAPRPFNALALAGPDRLRGPRLAMTATPAYEPAPLSMRDREKFGGVAHRYYLRAGVDAGFVNPFGLKLVCGGALAEQVATAAAAVSKLLVFCRDIKHARALRAEVAALTDAPLYLAHSRMPAAEVGAALRDFAAPGARGVMFNCRLFQEGVEIPHLDAVFFAAPRRSTRDIIQSLCRPLNRAPGKGPSAIFLPVEDQGDAKEKALARFAPIVPVFDALAQEDPRLYEYLLDPGGAPYPVDCVGPAAEALRAAALAGALRAVRHGLRGDAARERLLRAERIPWALGFAELRRVVERCERYPKTTDGWRVGGAVVNFYAFYNFCREGYALARAGKESPLEPHQVADLETLRGWEPYGVEGPYTWRASLRFLEEWLERDLAVKGGEGGEGVAEPPPVEINKGGFCGLNATALERLAGTLTVINQGSFGKIVKGELRQGLRVPEEKQAELDRICARFGLRWRKEFDASGAVDEARPTFIQEAHSRFKALYERACAGDAEAAEFMERWFPGYPEKHAVQEELGTLVADLPPRYRAAKDGKPEAIKRDPALELAKPGRTVADTLATGNTRAARRAAASRARAASGENLVALLLARPESLTKDQLASLARAKGLRGVAGLSKAALAKATRAAYTVPASDSGR